MGPRPAVAETRSCVRHCLDDLDPGDLVLAACSGGSDSLALAAALAHEAPRLGLRGGGVTVDHGLQAGSARRAGAVAAMLAGLGLDPVRSVRVAVAAPTGHGGPEAAARAARYEALDGVARSTGAAAVLLGHTRDDRRRPCCLAWRVAPARAHWRACRPGAAATAGRCSASAAPPSGKPARHLASSRGTTRRR